MKNERPLAGGEEACVSFGSDNAVSSTTPSGRATKAWQNLEHEYRTLNAALAHHCVLPCPRDEEGVKVYEAETERLADLHADALTALLIHPAPTVGALADKLDIFNRERIEEGWWRGREIVSMIACDAERLLWSRRHLTGE